jgi:alpha-beta hydrolase superfamily lysophospholipase
MMNTNKVASATALLLAVLATDTHAACVDSVVLVHGNTGSPQDFASTVAELKRRGYTNAQIHVPAWGSRSCAACNDHYGSEEEPVARALSAARQQSCTGRIDVIAHSMGATLAAQQISKLGISMSVDAFVGIAGAFRGLWTCGTYPFHVPTSTCGAWGLSVASPLLSTLAAQRFATRTYTLMSWSDQVVCATGVCTVGGVHSSTVPGQTAAYTLSLGHFGLLTQTAALQADLIH